MKARHTESAEDREKAAMLTCSSLVANLMPAAELRDIETHPPLQEAAELHREAKALRDELRRKGLSWEEVLPRLRAFVEDRPTPVQDFFRSQHV